MTKWRYLTVNKHFISSGSLFHPSCSASVKPSTDGLVSVTGQSFNFIPFSVQEVHKALKALDPFSGADLVGLYFLKLAADFIAEPLTYCFNITVKHTEIPMMWKSAFVFPLFKGGDPTILNNYRPISKLFITG